MSAEISMARIFFNIFIILLFTNVNYPQTKDLLASDFIEERPFKRLGLLSSPSV